MPCPLKILLLSLLVFFVDNMFPIKISAQTINRLSGTSARDMQISVTNSFGVRTSIDANSNVKARNSASINLLPGSQIDDAFGDSQGNANANFTISPTGANMSINGIQSRNIFLFGQGTQFNSEMESIDNPDTTKPLKGTASSMAVHEFGVKIKSQQSQFSNSFSQSF